MRNISTITKKAEFIILLLFVFMLLSAIAFAIPNSLTLQGKLTNLAGSSQVGTFNFTFRIYDAATDGNELWASANQSVTTDANGIYDVILTGINLSFADQYYLGIAVGSDNESTPRINLTSAPYSFRANTSEALNPNQSFVVRNLSITGNATIGDGTTTLAISTQSFNATASGNLILANNITLGDQVVFRLGEIIDNLVNGWLKITGGLNITGGAIVNNGLNVSNGLNVISGNVGIGTASPDSKLHVIGGLCVEASDTGCPAATGNLMVENNVGIGTTPSAKLVVMGNLSVNNTDGTSRLWVDTSTGNVGIGTASPTYRFESPGNASINGTLYVSSGNVGIGTTAPGQALHVVGSANISTTLNAPVINTTRTDQNLTISSSAGSVIIRLG